MEGNERGKIMMKYTPGPWTCSSAPGGWDAVREPGGQLICSLNLNNPENMRLIAAAPELLEALQDVVLDGKLDSTSMTLQNVMKAIAKATS